jgi:DNA-binding NtrC family response regulator
VSSILSTKDKPTILVVDDEQTILELIQDILQDKGYHVLTAENGNAARAYLAQHIPQVVLLDIRMPDIDGLNLLREFKHQEPTISIVMMSEHDTIDSATEVINLGASDFIEKPLSAAKLLRCIERALANQRKLIASKQYLCQEPIGKSPETMLLRKQAQRVAKHNMPILLIGEAGTGKRCFAHYLHALGSFSGSRFIELSPETFPVDSLKLSALADHNCLYLNNVSQLDDKAQFLLLHMLESGKIKQSQLIFANQGALEEVVTNGSFNEALFYNINSITLFLPKLSDHIEDIPELIHHFVNLHITENQLPYRHFSVAAQNKLQHYPWPGNIIELKNVIQRLLLLGENDEISETDVDLALMPSKERKKTHNTINYELPLREAREQFERIYLLYKLQQTAGNVGKAAKLAGMERTHLYRKLHSLDIAAKKA